MCKTNTTTQMCITIQLNTGKAINDLIIGDLAANLVVYTDNCQSTQAFLGHGGPQVCLNQFELREASLCGCHCHWKSTGYSQRYPKIWIYLTQLVFI